MSNISESFQYVEDESGWTEVTSKKKWKKKESTTDKGFF